MCHQKEPNEALTILSNIFKERQKKNGKYSLRAFARDLKFSQPFLSMILDGARPLTVKTAERVVRRLLVTEEERSHFLERCRVAEIQRKRTRGKPCPDLNCDD